MSFAQDSTKCLPSQQSNKLEDPKMKNSRQEVFTNAAAKLPKRPGRPAKNTKRSAAEPVVYDSKKKQKTVVIFKGEFVPSASLRAITLKEQANEKFVASGKALLKLNNSVERMEIMKAKEEKEMQPVLPAKNVKKSKGTGYNSTLHLLSDSTSDSSDEDFLMSEILARQSKLAGFERCPPTKAKPKSEEKTQVQPKPVAQAP